MSMLTKPPGQSRESKNGYGLSRIKHFVCFMPPIRALAQNSNKYWDVSIVEFSAATNERVYNGYCAAFQQKCLAHLRRHFLRLIQRPGRDNAAIGNAFVDLIDDAFDNYHQFQVSNNVADYTDWATQFKSKLSHALDKWIPKASATALNLLSKLRAKSDQWWYFLDHPEVPPDNNLAQRSLRLAVTKRKVSGGSRSLTRFEDTASLLTVVQTCRSKGSSVIDFFASALRAYVGHENAYPSLIPFSST